MTLGAIQPAAPTRERVRELAEQRGTCLTVYLPPHRPAAAETTARTAVRAALQVAGARLRERGERGPDIEDLLRPLVDLAAQEEFERGHAESWAIFRSADRLEFLRAPAIWNEQVVTADRFVVLPLLAWLVRQRECLLLAVTHKGVRLYRFEDGRLEALALPPAVPGFFDEERMRNAAEHGAGRSAGVHFGVTATSDRAHKMYRDYFAEVGRGLRPLLEKEGLPLVLAGAKETVSDYRDAAGDPHLITESLGLSPDGGFSERDLEAKLTTLLEALPLPAELRAAERIRALGPRKSVRDLAGAARAAAEGRVSDLFLTEPVPDDTLAVNQAAIETLTHGGEVWVVPPGRMPGAGPVIAGLRF
jgi:Bacterial archaeo-eukaryotic release factor family 3